MEFSEICSFFININHQSIKLILKNGKSMASIAIITHSLLSILLFLFSISIKSLLYSMNNSFMEPYYNTPAPSPASGSSQGTFPRQMLMYLALLLLVEFTFIIAFVATSHISSVAAILISAASCTGEIDMVSSQDFLPMISKRWKRPWTTGFRRSWTQPARYSTLVVFLVVFVCVMYPSPLTISISVLLGVISAILVMYSSVAWILAMVASVVEEGCSGKEALEKGERLAEGRRVHGFLLNIFFNSVALVLFLGCWWIFVYYKDFSILWLVMINIFSLVKMLATVEYTVFYFECKKYHEEDIEVLFGNLQYTKVPSADIA